MDVRHLRALVAVAETGGFSAAAVSLGTVQSNISTHIARLERELDAILIDRATGRLSDEGELVVVRARRLIAEIDAIGADVAAMRDQIRGRVRLGIIGTAGRWLMPLLFNRVNDQFPQLHLSATDGTNTLLEPRLANGELDLAVVTMPVTSDELRTVPLFQEELVLAFAAHETSDRHVEGPLRWDELSKMALILPAHGTPLRMEIDAAAAAADVVLSPIMEIDGVRMIASLTFDGHGPAILPATAFPPTIKDRFAMVPIEGLPPRMVGMALRTKGHPSAPTRAIMNLLGDIVSDPINRPNGVLSA